MIRIASTEILNPISQLLWGVAITIFFMVSFKYFIVGRKKEELNDKILIFGFSGFFLCQGIAWIFWNLDDLYLKGKYVGHSFIGNLYSGTEINSLLDKFGTIFLLLGITLFIFSFEFVIKKTKYSLTCINILCFILMIVLPYYDAVYLIGMAWLLFATMSFIILLTVLIRWSEVEFKAIGSFIILGFLLYIYALVLNFPLIKSSNLGLIFHPPVFCILGSLVCAAPLFIDPKFFSNVKRYWIGFSISMNSLNGLIFVYLMLLDEPILFMAGSVMMFLSVLLSVYILSTELIMKSPPVTQDKEDHPKVLSIFTKPQKITEEEISISKEKKICLICKSKLSRLNYICPECSTLYCVKCSNTLPSLENSCWVCGTAIDESKPVRRQEEAVDQKVIGKQSKKDIGKKQ